ncbi:MAG TPA: helix-turn-helix domain-containing protein, partial [Candidatus Obscuribacter sp.]|nr:helix-turn-helix domain-containing protein [Candidatus Obscuribacter sp.]
MPSPSFLEMRSRNAIHILQAVRESPGMSRAELAKVCDLAKSTVSSIVDQLTEATILTESGPKPS